METNFFRFAIRELADMLEGLRLQKIYAPTSDCWTLDIGKAGYLIFKSSRKGGFFFVSGEKPENPMTPSAMTMKLRKTVCNRRIEVIFSAWPERKAAFKLSGKGTPYLIFDFCRGLELQDDPGVEFKRETAWPELDEILINDDAWRDYPQLSPPLRRELHSRSRSQAQDLLDGMRSGEPEGFFVCASGGKEECFPWKPVGADQTQGFASALQAAAYLGVKNTGFVRNTDVAAEKKVSRERRRLKKNLQKIEEDEARLKRMVARGQYARLIQNNLFRLPKDAKVARIKVLDEQGSEVDLDLDPSLSVRDNMQYLFARERKGRRGLKFIAHRREKLQAELDNIHVSSLQETPYRIRKRVAGKSAMPRKYRNMAVHVFESDDGYLLLRGKNSKANHQLLSRVASPFDYWLHVRGGPGAHVILKRDHPQQHVPDSSLEQAAALAGYASYRRDDDRAEILYAYVRDVRKIKGAELGQVVVDKIQGTVVVELSAELESRLKIT
ncbi:MAG: NFACT RNA binding domain-containing protein [Thermodesulfobacteriota bacterium]